MLKIGTEKVYTLSEILEGARRYTDLVDQNLLGLPIELVLDNPITGDDIATILAGILNEDVDFIRGALRVRVV
jgi:hypothetical protein